MTKPYPGRKSAVRNRISSTQGHRRRPFQIVLRPLLRSAASQLLVPVIAVSLAVNAVPLAVNAVPLAVNAVSLAVVPGHVEILNQAAAQSAEYVFDRYEIDVGPASRQTVLAGFLLGGGVADLAVVKIDEDGERRVRVYAFDGGTGTAEDEDDRKSPEYRPGPPGKGAWRPRMEAPLRPGVSFVDVARIGNHDRLITYGEGRLNAWDPGTASEYELASVTSNFTPPREDEVPHVDVTRDVNGDGRIDLVVPAGDAFQVFIQLAGGSFADPVEVGPPVDLDRIYGADGYRYDPWSVSRVHAFDYNGDGRVDLVSWRGDRFEAHIQDGQGLFDSVAVTFTTAVRFDSDDLSTLAGGDMAGRVLHSFGDLNGDGVADMVIYALEGDSISDKRSAYEVHFGTRNADGRTRFASESAVSIQSEGHVQLAMERRDVDGNGEPDLVITTIENRYLESSLFKRIKGFMGDDVWLNLAFYRIDEGRIPDQPTSIRKIQLDGAPSPREPGWVPLDVVLLGGKHVLRKDRAAYPRAFNKNLFLGDVTGNGRSDLLIEWTHRELHVFAGVPGPDLFAGQPRKVAVDLPNDEEYAWMTDLNRDGRQDIVMHHPFTKRDAHGAPMELPGTEPQRVILLIAR